MDETRGQSGSLARRPGGAVDDLLIIDDIDLTDDSEIRTVVSEVEAFLESKHGVRLSILTAEQWLDALSRSLSPAMRRGAERHLHILRDKNDPYHLLVSPSAVGGINEGSRVIYAEVVYHVLRCVPTTLSSPLRRGLDDLMAQWMGERLGIDLFTRNFPEESELVMGMLQVLSIEFGYQSIDWARLLRRDPDKFFHALERSKFARLWLSRARQEAAIELPADRQQARRALITLLRSEALTAGSTLVALTKAAIQHHLEPAAETS